MNTQMPTSNLNIVCVILAYATFVGAKLDPNELTEEQIGKIFNYHKHTLCSMISYMIY